jgi:hypothetical protein
VEPVNRVRGVERQTSRQVEASANTELTIRTADGDTVRLSLESNYEQSYSDYGFKVRGAGISERYRERSNQVRQSGSVEIEVEGSLSHDELQDIAQLIQKLAANGANGNASRYKNLSTLQSFDYRHRVEATYSEQSSLSSFEARERR